MRIFWDTLCNSFDFENPSMFHYSTPTHTHTKKDVKIPKVEYKQKQLDLTVIQIHRITIFSGIVKQNMLTPYHQTAY